MHGDDIKSLEELARLRSAPKINKNQKLFLSNELKKEMALADWFTVGIMAPSEKISINAIRCMERRFNWPEMKIATQAHERGPVYLKANQKTGSIHIRVEYGLGEGVLISCQFNEESIISKTLGPFPLDFF
tara:strand:- start:664 stop:1056 length:393 start_codon:yes stop_codon:yes gene_type:complete